MALNPLQRNKVDMGVGFFVNRGGFFDLTYNYLASL